MVALGEAVHRFEVPTPFEVGSANCYLIEGNPLTLIDTGPNSEESIRVLKTRLSEIGFQFSDIEQILITHGHVDHFGMACYISREVQREHGEKPVVAIHRQDVDRVKDYDEFITDRMKAYMSLITASGTPDELTKSWDVNALAKFFQSFGESLPYSTTLNKDSKILSSIGLEMLWVPGHSYGSVCYVSEGSELVFSGDHLLGDISSNPSLDFDQPDRIPMVDYFSSLDKIEEFQGYLVLPGHREPVESISSRVSSLKDEYRKKRRLILNNVSDNEKSIYEISRKVFGEYTISSLVLALAETQDLCRILQEDGRVDLVVRNGINSVVSR